MFRPISSAVSGSGWLMVGIKGISRMDLGSRARKSWIMVVLPVTTALLICRAGIWLRDVSSSSSPLRVLSTIFCRRCRPSRFWEKMMREMTSSPAEIWAL